MIRNTLPLLLLLGLPACTEQTPTSIETPAPDAQYANGAGENPWTFQREVGFVLHQATGEGDACRVQVADPDNNDFVKAAPDRVGMIHVHEGTAPLSILVDGVTYVGEGNWTGVFWLAPGGGFTSFNSHVTGTVYAPGDPDTAYTGSCRLLTGPRGRVIHNEVEVH